MLQNITNATRQSAATDKIKEEIESIEKSIADLNDRTSDIESQLSDSNGCFDTLNVAQGIYGNQLEIDASVISNSVSANCVNAIDVHTASVSAELVASDCVHAQSACFGQVCTSCLSMTDVQANNVQSSMTRTTCAIVDDTLSAQNANISSIQSNGTICSKCSISNTLCACSVISNSVSSDNIVSDNGYVGTLCSADIVSCTATIPTIYSCDVSVSSKATVPILENTYIQGSGQINLDPNQITETTTWAIDIPSDWNDYNVQLSGHRTIDGTTKYWSVHIVGSDNAGIAIYSQDALDLFHDISYEDNKVRIRVRAEDYIDWHAVFTGTDVGNLQAVVDLPSLATLHVPEQLQGYIFQSYGDDTTEFYFGGRVRLHSLISDVQEFDTASYNNIQVYKKIRLPLYDTDGNFVEWDSGQDNQYITYRNGVLTWEDPSESISSADTSLATSATVAGYTGKTTENCYPIVHLGCNTAVHGNMTVCGNAIVCCQMKTPHLYDGTVSTTMASMPDSSLILDGGLKRKTTKSSSPKYDEIAVYESTATLENEKPLVYNSDNKSIQTATDLDIDSITATEGTFNTIHATHGYFTKVTTTEEETISTGSDNVVLRQNNSTKLKDGQLSGFVVNNYDGDGNVAIVGTDNDGTVRVGTASTATHSYAEIYLKDGKWYTKSGTTYTEITPGGELVAYSAKAIDNDYTKYTNAVFAVFTTSNTVPIAARDEEANMTGNALSYWDSDTLTIKTISSIPNDVYKSLTYDISNGNVTYKWDTVPGVYCFASKAEYEAVASKIAVGSTVYIANENTTLIGVDG